jgi:c-di-GMP-binding flagellar brake protein YcgR
MSHTTDWELSAPEPDKISGDRRRDRRYEVCLDVKWKLIRRRKVLDTGTGRTVDLSSGGILIEAERPLPVGLNLELSITWPVLLHEVAPLQLVVAGRIVRARGKHVAIRKVQHEFRTVGVPSEQRAALGAGTRPQVAVLNPAQERVELEEEAALRG